MLGACPAARRPVSAKLCGDWWPLREQAKPLREDEHQASRNSAMRPEAASGTSEHHASATPLDEG
eukprot:12310440-Alexandrium_andersonii.AAC.1